ncbi:MAG: phosphopantothenate/pantothenate synthetase [Methanosarcinales archaeon]|nr:phosphopantothenate/pantothenate synthetase [Methanosarcinales archaeon]
MTDIPKDHPRYLSLMTRELIIQGVEKGITGITGLIAQGRGEAFDYLLGEQTIPSASEAGRTAAAALVLAKSPVISVNGNTAALVAEELVKLSTMLGAPLEVNLFYKTQERVQKIIEYLQSYGAYEVLGARPDCDIAELSSERKHVCKQGIFLADVVCVPLEDGDRCEALRKMGKTVIVVDLNPLSRTAQSASVCIVDNIVRAMPNIIELVDEMKGKSTSYLQEIVDGFDNKQNLDDAMGSIYKNLKMKHHQLPNIQKKEK